MKEKIKVKNGVLTIFNVDETCNILKIGYTLNEDETGYNNAIIVREGENNNIITDNEEVIMRFLNLYAMQNKLPLNRIFDEPYIERLSDEDEEKLNDLIDEKYYLEELREKKKKRIELMVISFIISLISCGIISMDKMKDKHVATSIVMLVSSILTGKFYSDAIHVPIPRVQQELDDSVQEFGEYLLDEKADYESKNMIRR